MYQYDALDQAFVDRRVAEFRDQMRRHLAGELSEDEFRPLRLRNGLYVQRHAPMLRIAIPYGLLAARQLAKLADIARRGVHRGSRCAASERGAGRTARCAAAAGGTRPPRAPRRDGAASGRGIPRPADRRTPDPARRTGTWRSTIGAPLRASKYRVVRCTSFWGYEPMQHLPRRPMRGLETFGRRTWRDCISRNSRSDGASSTWCAAR